MRTTVRIPRSMLALVVLLAVMLGGEPLAARQPSAGLYTTETVPCPAPLPLPSEVEGKTYDCGVVVVPENYAAPSGRTIELAYLRLRSTSASPAQEPVFYLSGGPGGSAIREFTRFKVLLDTMGSLRQSRDIVAYDQRGTGYSGILACGSLQAGLGVIAARRPDLAMRINDLNSGLGQQALLYGSCAAVYKDAGVDLAQYNSVASARDIASVARTLGYPQGYHLYGTSYGTRLALEAMRTTPAQVRTVILDGVDPPDVQGIGEDSVQYVEQYRNIFAQCAADAACNAAYPDLERRFVALLRQIGATPLAVAPPVQTNPVLARFFGATIAQITPRFFTKLASANNGAASGGLAPLVPRLIADLERGDATLLRRFLAADASPAATTPDTSVALRPEDERIRPDNQFLAAPIALLLDQAAAAARDPKDLPDVWLTLVLADLRGQLVGGKPQADVVTALVDLTLVPIGGVDGDALIAYADTHLSAATAATADALVRQMGRNDVRATMWNIQDAAGAVGGTSPERGLSEGLNFAINCAEDIAFTSKEDVQRYIDASPYPGLISFTADEFVAVFQQTCRFYPPTMFDRGITAPVTSAIPALLFASSLDTQTPPSGANRARRTLSTSYLVEWKNQGHVIANRSEDGCAGSIAAAFIADPSRQPDSSCSRSAAYTLRFLLPSDPLPEPAGG